MLRMCSQLVNAAVFGSLAVLTTKPAPLAELMAQQRGSTLKVDEKSPVGMGQYL